MYVNGWSDEGIYATKAEASRHCVSYHKAGYLTKIRESKVNGKHNGWEVWAKEKNSSSSNKTSNKARRRSSIW